ncbi:MAG: glycosyltransferase family 1 protein [Methanobacterium sp.]|jgi:glycosyltransferase involved in cell wall biosynthesis
MSKIKVDAVTGVSIKGMFGRNKVYTKISEKLYDKVDFKEVPYVGCKLNVFNSHILYNRFFYPKIAQKYIRNDSDIIHIFSQEDTYLLNSLKTDSPKIATCLDTIGLILEEYGSIEKSFKRYSINSMKKADRIITISNHTKYDLIKETNISPDKVETIYLGVDEQFRELPQKEVENVKKKYKLPEKFILYVGSEQSRKNLPVLIKAFKKLLETFNLQNIKLVKVGRPQIKESQRKKIFNLIDKLNLQKHIIFIEYVPEEDIASIYNAADIFVFPSFYEGFGLPPLEAMACGTPVITSNVTSLPEVVGDAGIMINPHNIDGLANKMYELLTNDGLKDDLRKKGLNRAKLFSWDKTAHETFKIYEDIIK